MHLFFFVGLIGLLFSYFTCIIFVIEWPFTHNLKELGERRGESARGRHFILVHLYWRLD